VKKCSKSRSRASSEYHPIIAHARANCVLAISLRGDHDFAAATRAVAHGSKAFDDEIESRLAAVDRIGLDRGQIWVQQSLHLAGMKHCVGFYHLYDIHNKIVQIHPLVAPARLFYHAPDAPITSPARRPSATISKQVAELAEIDIAAIDKALPSTGVADNSGEGLIQFNEQWMRPVHPSLRLD